MLPTIAVRVGSFHFLSMHLDAWFWDRPLPVIANCKSSLDLRITIKNKKKSQRINSFFWAGKHDCTTVFNIGILIPPTLVNNIIVTLGSIECNITQE